MDNKTVAILLGVLGGIGLLVLGALGVATIVSGDDSAPAPTVTVTPAPTATVDPLRDILEQTWNQQTPAQQDLLCAYFNTNPAGAYDAFVKGAGGEILPESTFDEFLTSECSTF